MALILCMCGKCHCIGGGADDWLFICDIMDAMREIWLGIRMVRIMILNKQVKWGELMVLAVA